MNKRKWICSRPVSKETAWEGVDLIILVQDGQAAGCYERGKKPLVSTKMW